MLSKRESLKVLRMFFNKNKIATLMDLFSLLETKSRMTAFRRLSELSYISSYSKAGRYYTLPMIPDFDSSGLWYFNDIGFSKFGNLKETAFNLIEHSEMGMHHVELEKKLRIRVHNTLLDLVHSERIKRQKTENGYLYTSIYLEQSKKQLSVRQTVISGFRKDKLADWIIIEILLAVIRTTQGIHIDVAAVVSALSARKITITAEQIAAVLTQHNLKKTLDLE